MLSMRSKKRFIVFMLMYTALIIWMSYSLQNRSQASTISLVIAIVVSIILSILYAWIIIRFRSMEIATLKCVGYTNSNIRWIILGEIIWVSIVSFLIVSELLIHYLAIDAYVLFTKGTPEKIAPFINIQNLVITVAIFLIAQIGGITLAYRKILKLRPIIALRVMK